jgi:hypothetical protein
VQNVSSFLFGSSGERNLLCLGRPRFLAMGGDLTDESSPIVMPALHPDKPYCMLPALDISGSD